MTIEEVLSGVTKLAIDTAPLIYFVEANPVYDKLVTSFFERIASGQLLGITSVITLTEILSHPIQQGDVQLQKQYRTLLLSSRNFDLLALDVVG